MRLFKTLFRVLFLNFLRDKQSLFFSLAFPVLFLLIFGFVFVGGEGEGFMITMGLFTQEVEEKYLHTVLEDYGDHLVVEEVLDPLEVEEGVQSNRFHFGLVYSKGEFIFYYNPTQIQNNQYYQQLAGSITTDVNRVRSDVRDFVTSKRHEMMPVEGISQMDYMLPGIVALGIFSVGIFSITGSFMHFRERGILKRLAATPIKKVLFLSALMVTRILVAIVSSILVVSVGRALFGFSPSIDWFLFLLFVIISTLSMMGFGFLITIFARSSTNASEIASIALTVMIFFSGIYIPMDFLPAYLQQVGRVLPLYYMAEGFRSVMNVDVMPTAHLFLLMGSMLIIAALFIRLASKYISWEERI